MPFVKEEKDKNKKNGNSLQVQKPTLEERAFATHTRSLSGNLTLEAALVLPLFLLIILSFLYFIVILDLQFKIQIKLEEIAREAAGDHYLGEEIPGYAGIRLMSGFASEEMQQLLENSFITDGIQGIKTAGSDFFGEDGIIDYVISYEIRIPFIPDNLISLPMVQRCRFRIWNGEEIKEVGGEESERVYVTETGTVYHLDPGCTHICLSIRGVAWQELETERNEGGGKYKKCSSCEIEVEAGGKVYVTEEGDRWHASLSCSSLKRSVSAIDRADIGSRQLCSRCGEEEE